MARTLERHGGTCVYQEREAGQEFGLWAAELPRAIGWALGFGLGNRLAGVVKRLWRWSGARR